MQVAHFARVVLWQKAIVEISKAIIATAKIKINPEYRFLLVTHNSQAISHFNYNFRCTIETDSLLM